jgi:hypothetical protein
VFCAEDFLGYVYQRDSDSLWRAVAWVGQCFDPRAGQFPTERAAIENLMELQHFEGRQKVANDVEVPGSSNRA